MKLKDLFTGVKYSWDFKNIDIENIDIENIAYNSQEVRESYIFVALIGETTDGHNYVKNAYKNGARVFVVSKDVKLPQDSIKIFVENTRKTLSEISSNFFGDPSKEIKVIGITGTKGKTTTSNYIRSILEKAGHPTGIIGTNGVFYGIMEASKNTTPESYEIQRILRDMVSAGMEYVVMEASSGGLKMNRVDNVEFDLAIYTNISKDHIGPKEHPDFQDYLESKIKLFQLAKHGLINKDDKYAQEVIDKAKCTIDTYAIEKESDFKARNIEISKDIKDLGSAFTLQEGEKSYKYKIYSPGIFSIYNTLASIAVARYLGIENKIIKEALKGVRVSGRVELLPLVDYASVVLDFAHNGASLKNIIETLKEYPANRLICLLGSVGDRSYDRRKEMGDIVAKECDIAILTSDNPGYEDPLKIIEDMAGSFKESDCLVIKEVDRKRAIKRAINMLEKDDMLLLAGKGHETYQLIRGKKHYFSDKEVAKKAARELIKGIPS